jgi:hypothetical protein
MQRVRVRSAQLFVVAAVTDVNHWYLAVSAVERFAERAFRRLALMAIELRPLASATEPPRGC